MAAARGESWTLLEHVYEKHVINSNRSARKRKAIIFSQNGLANCGWQQLWRQLAIVDLSNSRAHLVKKRVRLASALFPANPRELKRILKD
jgi:hypothetical protein